MSGSERQQQQQQQQQQQHKLARGGDGGGGGRGGGSFSPLVMACFTLNYIVGTGFLALPWAFHQAGWLLSGLVLMGVCFAANIGSDFILSAMARAEWVMMMMTTTTTTTTTMDTRSDGFCGGEEAVAIRSSSSGDDDDDDGLLEGGKVVSLTELSSTTTTSENDENTSLVKAVIGMNTPSMSTTLKRGKKNETKTYGTVPTSESIERSGGGRTTTTTTTTTTPSVEPLLLRQLENEDDSSNEKSQKQQQQQQQQQPIIIPPPLVIGQRRRMVDVPELCRIFLGEWGFRGYAFCVSYYLYGALWSFTSVFGSAVALALTVVPSTTTTFLHHQAAGAGHIHDDDDDGGGDGDPYALSVLLFAILVVPMSFLDLNEQKAVQVVLSGGRILMIILMIITPLVAAAFACDDNDDENNNCIPHFDNQKGPASSSSSSSSETAATIALLFSGIPRMMPVVVYAAIFHFSIPSLAEEVTDKSQVGNVFGLTFILCGVLYTCIGGIDSWYFGAGIEQSANLNWGTYHGGTGRFTPAAAAAVGGGGEDEDGGSWVDVALWARALSGFVVMFPALNVISAFPLHAFSLGNNLMGIYYGENIHDVEHNRCIKSAFRAISCLPPLMGGLLVRNLGTITDFAGLAGLAIAFCFPALLYIGSERAVVKVQQQRQWQQQRRYASSSSSSSVRPPVAVLQTRYQRFGSSSHFSAMIVLAFGVISILVVFTSLVFFGA